MSRVFCFIASMAFAATATSALAQELVGVDPSTVRAIASIKATLLPGSVKWDRVKNNTQIGVLAGDYVATSENALGAFHTGQAPSVYMRTTRGDYILAYGGVWLPHSKTQMPRFFIVQDESVRRGASLESAIASKPQAPYQGPGWLTNMLLVAATKGQFYLLAEVDDAAVATELREKFGSN